MGERTILVNRCGQWVKTEMQDLSNGDNFRLIEEDGTEFVDRQGNNVLQANGEPYSLGDGLWAIDIHDEIPETVGD